MTGDSAWQQVVVSWPLNDTLWPRNGHPVPRRHAVSYVLATRGRFAASTCHDPATIRPRRAAGSEWLSSCGQRLSFRGRFMSHVSHALSHRAVDVFRSCMTWQRVAVSWLLGVTCWPRDAIDRRWVSSCRIVLAMHDRFVATWCHIVVTDWPHVVAPRHGDPTYACPRQVLVVSWCRSVVTVWHRVATFESRTGRELVTECRGHRFARSYSVIPARPGGTIWSRVGIVVSSRGQRVPHCGHVVPIFVTTVEPVLFRFGSHVAWWWLNGVTSGALNGHIVSHHGHTMPCSALVPLRLSFSFSPPWRPVIPLCHHGAAVRHVLATWCPFTPLGPGPSPTRAGVLYLCLHPARIGHLVSPRSHESASIWYSIVSYR